jgi:dTDP-4-amino-4,6-dideoxygalactose transaminase
MIAPVLSARMRPLFYPTTDRGSPDLDMLQRMDLTGARAMLVAHYFGPPQPMAVIRAFCDERGIGLIEDCAHAFFGTSDGRSVGTWGDLAIASLTKFYPVPEGGLLASTTRPLDSLHLTPRSLRDELKGVADAIEIGSRHGSFRGVNWLFNGMFGLKRWVRRRNGAANAVRPPNPDHNPLLDHENPASAVRWITDSVAQARIVSLRRRNYALLAQLLSNVSKARVMSPLLPADATPYVFPLYVDDPEARYQSLRAAGVPVFRWDQLWPGTPALPSDYGVDWATHVFQLGCHQDLSAQDIESIAATVRRIIEI